MSDKARLANTSSSRGSVTIGVEASIIGLLNCVALIGNISVCTAIWRNLRLRQNISNTFVFALAVSDIVIAALCMPFTLGTVVNGKWIFGSIVCQLQGFTMFTFAMNSIQTMGLISLNRYYCIVKRSKYQQLFKKYRTIAYIMLAWCISLFGTVPPLFLNIGGYAFQPGKAMCLYTFEANIPYTIFIEVVYIGSPLILITTCYYAVLRKVYRNNQVFLATQENIHQLRTNVREAKVSKTLASVILAFVICWIPISIIDFIDVINGQPRLQRQVYQLYTVLAFISSSINPFIYGIFSRTFLYEYKKMMRAVVFCKFCRQHTVEQFVTSAGFSAEENPVPLPQQSQELENAAAVSNEKADETTN